MHPAALCFSRSFRTGRSGVIQCREKSAEEIDRYFAENLPEQNYNLWLGKADRIYLHGAWKFRLIANSARNNKGVRRNLGISREGVESDLGEQKGFFKPEYDDSNWLNQPVPFSWSERFLNEGYVKNGSPYLPVPKFLIHEGWYRRSFVLPKKWKTGRTILHFRGVANKAKVYVNGTIVCTHENISPGHYWVGAGNTEDRFFCDITPYLKSGKNLLAVKVFSSARNGGIWQTVYLERKENLYTEKMLPSFDYRTGTLKLRVFFMNTGKAVNAPKLEFEFKPWNSFRYQRQWKEQKFSVSAKTIPGGESEQTFTISLKDPKLWSPANPNLYHLIVKDPDGRIIGQERIGLRTFELGKNCFLLNGKRIFPMGENSDMFCWAFPGRRLMNQGFGVLNKDRMMEKTWERYMGCGNTIFRGNGHMPLDMQMDFALFRINMNIGKGGGGGSISKNDLNLVGFRNVGDWRNIKEIPEAYIGWRMLDPSGGVEVGAYVLEWINPEPQVEIDSIDFSSKGIGIPILIGISYLN